MKTKTIYWIVGIAAVAGLGIIAYRQGWFGGEEMSNASAGHGTNPNKKRRCVDKCLKDHPTWKNEECMRACEPTQIINQQQDF